MDERSTEESPLAREPASFLSIASILVRPVVVEVVMLEALIEVAESCFTWLSASGIVVKVGSIGDLVVTDSTPFLEFSAEIFEVVTMASVLAEAAVGVEPDADACASGLVDAKRNLLVELRMRRSNGRVLPSRCLVAAITVEEADFDMMVALDNKTESSEEEEVPLEHTLGDFVSETVGAASWSVRRTGTSVISLAETDMARSSGEVAARPIKSLEELQYLEVCDFKRGMAIGRSVGVCEPFTNFRESLVGRVAERGVGEGVAGSSEGTGDISWNADSFSADFGLCGSACEDCEGPLKATRRGDV